MESQRQTEGFGPSVTHGWATQPRLERSAVMVRRTWGQYVAVCPRFQLTSHTQPTSTLSRIVCERYIFIKKCVRSFIEVRILCLIMFLLILVYANVCDYTTRVRNIWNHLTRYKRMRSGLFQNVSTRRCPWCNCYRRRKRTRRHEFKSWTKLITFHIALIPLGKVWIQLFSLQLWVNSRAD